MGDSPNKTDQIKEQYPPGTRIELISMQDDYAVPSGTMGTVKFIDSIGTLHMAWDNGSTLGLILGEDSFRVIQPEQDDTQQMGGISL